MKRFRLLNMMIAVLIFWSCTDDWSFSTDSRYRLDFSADTVKFDTVFAGVASPTGGFMIYNENSEGLRFDAVMGGGAASPFRMNLDGEGGAVITGLEIPAGDSLFCFVSVNIPCTDDVALTDAFDSIRFILESGNVQHVRLSAHGQNSVSLKGLRVESDMTLTARLPYIIYDSLFVADGTVLTLAPGASLYFHSDAYLDVAGRIVARGKADSVILMRGDRLDLMLPKLPYDYLNGQWGGIRLRGSSMGNLLEYCDIHGGNWGVRADSSSLDDTKLTVISSIIHNVTGNGIEATNSRISVANSQITAAVGRCVDIAGGISDFTFCTIAGISVWSYSDKTVVLSDRRDGRSYPLQGASFRNCIITGRNATEFVTDFDEASAPSAPFSVSNSLIMCKDSTDARFSNVRFENLDTKPNGAYNFVDHSVQGYRSVYALDSTSRARGISDDLSTLWTVDLAGIARPSSGADAGCYQYVPLE